MSNRDWLNTFTSGMIFGAFILIMTWHFSNGPIFDRTVEEIACAEIQDRDTFLGGLLRVDGAEQSASLASGADEGPRASAPYDYCSLAAQQMSARSAAGAMWASWLSTGLTFVGVILLWHTLKATQQTLREAQNTTEAAVATAQFTREATDISHAQAVAFFATERLNVELVDHEGGFLRLAIRYECRNAGGTAASHAGVEARVAILVNGDAVEQRSLAMNVESGLVDVGAGERAEFYATLDRAISLDYVEQLRDKKVEMIIGLYGSYVDVFSEGKSFVAAYRSTVINFHEHPKPSRTPYALNVKMAKSSVSDVSALLDFY